MSDCLFCKIVAGEIPSTKVYEDDFAYAFLDIRPNNPGHTLVVPKEHHKNIIDIPAETLCNIMPAVKKVSQALIKGLGAEGINLSMNNEPVAGQIVFHAHIHVIPRFSVDGFKHWPSKPYKNGEEKLIAEKIISSLSPAR